MDQIFTNIFSTEFDNIYHDGNISKMADFDVFSLLEFRKRESRSHGLRQKGNKKRKMLAVKKNKWSTLNALLFKRPTYFSITRSTD